MTNSAMAEREGAPDSVPARLAAGEHVLIADLVQQMGGVQPGVLRPGDTLLLRVDPDRAAPDLVAEFKRQLDERLPDVEVLIIAADQVTVYRPGQLTKE